MQVKSYQEGDLINTIEGRQYCILTEIGSGGNSKVYKADEVLNNSNHLVILKDFSAGKQMMSVQQRDDYIQRELFINKKITEAEFKGALTIDYAVHDADNTHTYGVMTQVPKGATLREYVYSEAYKYTTLRDRVFLAKKIFTLIKNFHDTCKMIHGDISPDNIYVLSTGNELEYEQLTLVNLLDFGNAQMIGDEDLHSIKAYTAGYASAEKFSGETLTVLEDWYAALACFWFCLSGSSPDEFEVTDEHIAKVHGVLSTKAVYTNFYISGDVEQNNFISVRQEQYDVVENLLGDIFSNMHHVTDDVIEKVEGLLNILDETGISRERLFASLEEEYHTLRKSRFSGLDIIRRILPNVEFKLPRSSTKYYRSKNSRGELLQYIMNSCQDSLFMVGDGGMGKTTTLLNIMDETYNFSKERRLHPTVFLELCTLSQNVDEWYDNNEGGTFIEQFVASYFTKTPRRYLERNHPYVTALHEEFYRGCANGKKQYTIFLDGLNEIGFISEKSRKVFFDTLNHYLQYAKNLRIVITGRNDAYELSKEYLQRLYTEGLDDLTIEGVLNEAVQKDRLSHYEFRRIVNNRNEISSNEYRLWQCLKIPFFLMMYCMMSEKNNVTRQGEILKNFFHDKRETLNGEQVYGEKTQSEKKHRDKQYGEVEALRMDLSIRVILDFIIPEIALYMAFSNHYFISKEEILNVIHDYLEKNVSETQFQNWRKWYYGYETDVTNILSEINNIDNGDKIPEYACDMLGIMRFNANGAFFFTHQHFRDYFAACAYINRILLTLETTKHNADVYYAWEPKFHELLEPFESKMLPNYIAAPIGEILGECHNVSCFDATRGEWECSIKQREEQRVLERLLDRYRNHPNMENDKKASMGLKNILEILKHSRVQNDGKIDFAGISFRNLNLRGVSLAGIAMSRFGLTKALVADFTDSKGVVSALLKDDAMQKVECLAVHTLHNRMLIYSPLDNTLSEVDLEHSETKTLAVNIGVVYCAFYEQNGGILFVVKKENNDYSYQVCYLPQGAEEWSSTDLKNVKVDEADMLLDTLSVNNQNWDTRRLYPLHFKEGFFRLVLAWNERHGHKFSFIEAVEKYEEYERLLVRMLRQEFEIIHSKIREIRKLNIISKDFELAGYYHDLCEELWSKLCEWHHPYQLFWQDELQRFIVLLAHAKRFLDEVEKQSSAEILYRNSHTRILSERGTRLCMAITETCARMERWEEALQLFLEQAVSTMGEAYWRTFSWLIKKYNSSGAMPNRENGLHRERIISRRNKCAKKIWELPIIESEVLSFGVDAEEIRTLIRDKSANTTLIAELLIPSLNIPNFVFCKRDSNINQTTLCLLLKNYFLWCEGRTKYVSQGIARLATPFYEYKRETIIKYVLACGCCSVDEMQMFLELSGCRTLQKDKPQEQLVYTALKQCEMHRTNNPIEGILDMQNRTLYQLIQKRTKGESVINDALVKKCVRHYRSGLLYEVEFSKLSIRDVKLTKQQFVDAYYSIQVILMMLLVEVSCIYDHICAEQKGQIVQYMMNVFTLENIATDEYGGFLLYIDQPENMDVQYVEELKEEFQLSFELHQTNMDAVTVSRLQQMLILLKQYLEVLYMVEGGNAPELKILYDKGYYILALLGCIGVEMRSKEINDLYQDIMCKIKDLSICWTLVGGCKNFSITFYEQKYRINHFSREHQKANVNTGNRFVRYLHEVNEDLEVWDNIAEDARIIRKCATYIRHKIPNKIGVFLNGLKSCDREMKNISELLDEIMQGLGNDAYERTLRSKLLNVKQNLYIFK